MRVVFKLWAILIGLVSTLHMLWVFFQESFLGHSATFYEPSVPLAYSEFGMALSGMIALFVHMVEVIPSRSLVVPIHKLTSQERLSLGLRTEGLKNWGIPIR